MYISKLQFIAPQWVDRSFAPGLEEIIEAGVDWVQVRVKDMPIDAWVDIATLAVDICKRRDVTCIINDNPYVAMRAGAHGVHLGSNDMAPSEARKLLGSQAIIGGTANKDEDMQYLVGQGVDYIGLGPYRYTTTKKDLSPLLGLEGYQHIMTRFRGENKRMPVVAIGGIEPGDVASIMATGVDGIAASGTITRAADKKAVIASLWANIRQNNL